MFDVRVLNAAFQILGRASVEKAITLLYLKKAYSIEDSDEALHSPSTTIVIPKVIVLPDVKFVKPRVVNFSKEAVFKRDGKVCVYCGSFKFLTLDHLIPKSRWKFFKEKHGLRYGLNSFENCVCACRACNEKKSGKLLSELGWPEIKPEKPIPILDVYWDAVLTGNA